VKLRFKRNLSLGLCVLKLVDGSGWLKGTFCFQYFFEIGNGRGLFTIWVLSGVPSTGCQLT
jgi:hypothetical protein